MTSVPCLSSLLQKCVRRIFATAPDFTRLQPCRGRQETAAAAAAGGYVKQWLQVPSRDYTVRMDAS